MSIDAVRQVLDLFDRAVWVITAGDGDAIGGLVATFVNSASLVRAHPRLAVGIARHHHTFALIRRSRRFAAHLVGEREVDLVWRFGLASGHDVDKYSAMGWRRSERGTPILTNTLGWLECSIEADLDIGDRTIFIGAIVDGGGSATGKPLTAQRVWELATAEQRRRMDEDRRRDETLDASAIVEWRAHRNQQPT
jgi:flavin reductase (DIM6/NTAB) family NADH-FMN oxidoreductase RutF